MEIKTDNITELLREQIKKFDLSVDVSEVGEVIEIGDGVARVSGLENVMSSELVELPNGVFGMALNLRMTTLGLFFLESRAMLRKETLLREQEKLLRFLSEMQCLGV